MVKGIDVSLKATVSMDMPFHGDEIKLSKLRALHEATLESLKATYPGIEMRVGYNLACDLEQRIRVAELPGFVSYHRFGDMRGVTRLDWGACERFLFKWKH